MGLGGRTRTSHIPKPAVCHHMQIVCRVNPPLNTHTQGTQGREPTETEPLGGLWERESKCSLGVGLLCGGREGNTLEAERIGDCMALCVYTNIHTHRYTYRNTHT